MTLFDAPVDRPGPLARLGRGLGQTLRFWMQTEVHVYCFSVAASVLLSFFPFLIVMYSVCRRWPAAIQAINIALFDYFPENPATRFSPNAYIGNFIWRNLEATYAQFHAHSLQVLSLILLLFTANGIFLPLEVALNRIFGITRNRSYLKNQLISYGLIFLCGAVALLSTAFTALNQEFLRNVVPFEWAQPFLGALMFKIAALPMVILTLFLIYWLVPNGKVPKPRIAAAAIVVGLLLEALKYINLLTYPLLYAKVEREYGPFKQSVTLILWSFLSSMLVLAGAEWAARRPAGAPSVEKGSSG